MNNEELFKAINEMVKQFKNIKDEDEYRNKCIQVVYNTFNLDIYDAETIYDLAVFGNARYLSDTDSEIEFCIENDGKDFVCWINERKDYIVKYHFSNPTPIANVLKELDLLGQTIEKFKDFCDERYLKELKEGGERSYFEMLI